MIPDWQLGKLPETVGLEAEYFRRRGIFLDCRGPLVIHEGSSWGFQVVVLTESHDISEWGIDHGGGGHWVGHTITYGVTVEDKVWICSRSLLTGCHIGKGSIVAAGTVVRGQKVAPGVIVAGNPARVIARWNNSEKKWVYLKDVGYERLLS